MGSLWDEGDIAQAVTKAKKLGAVFIVFVEGSNDLSSHYNELFLNEKIVEKLKTGAFVAVKVQENSTAHQQFSAIYPHNSVPSIFFIGKNGKPLEIITDEMGTEEFSVKIDNIFEKAGSTTQDSSSTNIIRTEQASASVSSEIPSSSVESVQSQEEKIRYAKQLLEQKKADKQKQEEEDQRLKEIERRKQGQNVQQMKKWQKDEELKQLIEERDREKRENQVARDKVLAQIAQDKAERAARFSNQNTSTLTPSVQPVAQCSRPNIDSNVTKLQFRLPDGSSQTQEFKISDSLEVVKNYIQNQMNLPFTRYTMSTTFPRREFTDKENEKTLLELQLVPNAVVLILPQNQGVVSTNTNGMISSMFWWLLTPLFNIYDYFVGYFYGRSNNTIKSESTSAKRSSSEVEGTNSTAIKKQASDSTVIRRQGNIHRLRDRPDTDDDNNTWNGNSTQQM